MPVEHAGGRANGDGPGDHARAMAAFLTGCQARKTGGANIRGVSFWNEDVTGVGLAGIRFNVATGVPEPGSPYAIPAKAGRYLDEVERGPGKLRVAWSPDTPSGKPLDPAVLAVLAVLGTLGPTNTLLATAGVTVGLQRSLLLISAEAAGHTISILTLGLILRPVMAGAPSLAGRCVRRRVPTSCPLPSAFGAKAGRW